jgi:hypothetical protein
MRYHYFIFILLLSVNSFCKKSKSPIEQLPPETQTGANTFGCLVDGQLFKPGGAILSGGSLNCSYQYLGPGKNGGYHFILAAVKGSGSKQTSVGLFTDSLQITEGVAISLDSNDKRMGYGSYFGLGNDQSDWIHNTKKPLYTGELRLTKFDIINQIASGTFWFDATNANGKKVEIRHGRFDVRFTR